MNTREQMARYIHYVNSVLCDDTSARLSDRDIEHLYLLTDKNLSTERKKEVAKSTNNRWVKIELTKHNDLPRDIQIKLASDPDFAVRHTFAKYAKLPEVQKLLAQSPEILAELYLNPDLIDELKSNAKEAHTRLLFKGMTNDCDNVIRRSLGLKEIINQ